MTPGEKTTSWPLDGPALLPSVNDDLGVCNDGMDNDEDVVSFVVVAVVVVSPLFVESLVVTAETRR